MGFMFLSFLTCQVSAIFKMAAKELTLERQATRTLFEDLSFSYPKTQSK